MLGERGSGLSQGQRQLLAIARAALANPRLLILDEATSSVDTRTERLIQKALEDSAQGPDQLCDRPPSEHDPQCRSGLRDRQDGEIVEHGTHTELLAAKGFYYDLYMSQFRRDVPEPSGNGKGSPEAIPAAR